MPARRKKQEEQTELIHGVKPYVLKKGEKHMNKKQQEHFHAILHAWKKVLLDEINRTVNQMRDVHENHSDPNDRASQETDMSLELRSRDRESKLIKNIDAAIERLKIGDYGYCTTCGVEIAVQRLEARPTAKLCVDCKTLDEIRERQQG